VCHRIEIQVTAKLYALEKWIVSVTQKVSKTIGSSPLNQVRKHEQGMCHVWGKETIVGRCSEKSGGEEGTGIPKCSWQYSIKADLKGMGWEDVYLIHIKRCLRGTAQQHVDPVLYLFNCREFKNPDVFSSDLK